MVCRHDSGVYSIQDLLSTVSVLWSVDLFFFFLVNPPNGKSLLKAHQEQENICLTYRRYQLNSTSDKDVSSLSEVQEWKCTFGVGG